MVRNHYRPILVLGLFALAACGGGSMNSSVPASTSAQSAAQAAVQSQARTLMDKPAPAPKTDGEVVYNSILSPLAPIPSQGFECCLVKEFGDGVNLTETGILDTVSIVMDSWGCQTGDGNVSTGPTACTTTPGSTFNVPITLRVYAVCPGASCAGGGPANSHVGALLATQTKTFAIPYRPSADPARCPSNGTFYSDVVTAGESPITNPHCTHGLPTVIVFDAIVPQAGAPKNLPSQTIFTVAYNTFSGGYAPTGVHSGADSLNVGAEGPGGPTGSAYDPHGAFINYSTLGAINYCDHGTGGSNYLRLDTDVSDCWGPQAFFINGLHPQIKVTLSDKKDNDDKTKRKDN